MADDMVNMHHDQIHIRAGQVAALIADQLPTLRGLDITAVDGRGTVNAIFRIGNEATARFPLRLEDPAQVRAQLEREGSRSDEFRRACPFPAPEPLLVGEAGHGYPLPWSAQSWLHGDIATHESCADSVELGRDLAVLVSHLRAWDTRGRRFLGGGRGGALAHHDEWMDECIRRSEGLLDIAALRRMWHGFRRLPREDPDVMCHTDSIPGNILVADGRPAGVLDTGGFQAADPALDLVCLAPPRTRAPRGSQARAR